MSQPIKFNSHENFVGEGAGRSSNTKTHTLFSFLVEVEGEVEPDEANFQCRLEGSVDGEQFYPIQYRAPTDTDSYFVDGSDLAERDGKWGAIINSNSYAVEFVRANIIENTEDFEVTTTIFLNAGSARGSQYRELNTPEVNKPY